MNIATHTTPRPVGATVGDLIDDHLAALAESEKAWDAHSKMEDATRIPRGCVHYCNEIRWGKNGQETLPIFAYSVRDLEREVTRMDRGGLSLLPPKQQELVRVKNEARLAQLKEELLKDIEREKEAQKKAGLARLRAAADRASKREDKALDAIVGHDFATVAEVFDAAAHLVECVDVEEGVSAAVLVRFVEHLAGRLQHG